MIVSVYSKLLMKWSSTIYTKLAPRNTILLQKLVTRSDSQKCIWCLRNPKIHYHDDLYPQTNSRKIYFYITTPSIYNYLDFSSGLFSLGFATSISYAFVNSPLRATCHTHLTLLD